MSRVKIQYREFYDVPRVFIIKYRDKFFLFESTFDDEVDDYSKHYDVYLMPDLSSDKIKGSWEDINKMAVSKIGKVLVNEVKFDSTMRKYIDANVIEKLGILKGLW